MDREAWRAGVHGVTKSRTRLSDWTELNCNWIINYNVKKWDPKISRKKKWDKFFKTLKWKNKKVYILITCYPMYIYICFAYTKETLEVYKKETFHWIHFNPFWDLKHVTALSTQKKLFFKGFNGHHTEKLRASEIFHTRNSRIYRQHKWYCPWFYPDLTEPQQLMFLWRLYQNMSFRLKSRQELLSHHLDNFNISRRPRRLLPTMSSVSFLAKYLSSYYIMSVCSSKKGRQFSLWWWQSSCVCWKGVSKMS